MLGPPKDRRLDTPVLASLDALVPPDNFYRFLGRQLDLGFVRDWVAVKYEERGRPSIDPVVFFKLQLILFFEGPRSERKLIETASLHLAHRWYLGYALDEPLPDHSSLARIRMRLGLPIFQRFFERVVELCQEASLVWGKELFFDTTKVAGNADFDSLVPRFYLRAKEHVRQLFPDDTAAAEHQPMTSRAPHAEDPPADSADGAPPRMPFAGDIAAEQRQAASNQHTWRVLDALRLDPNRPSTLGCQRKADLCVSTTGPDAITMQTGVKPTLGYREHIVVDGGRARVILGAVLLPGDIMDNTPLPDLLRRAQFRWQLHPKYAVADARYGTTDNIRALEEAGIRAYMPVPDMEERSGYYPPSRFTYDAALDAYHCPEGQLLTRYTAKQTEDAVMYRPDAATCQARPARAACTESHQGRTLRRSDYAELVNRVKGYADTAAYARAMRRRQVWVEPLFGESKQWHNFRRLRLRGREKVNIEGQVVAAGQNLKRWLQAMGWGRRLLPGAPVCAAGAASFPTQ